MIADDTLNDDECWDALRIALALVRAQVTDDRDAFGDLMLAARFDLAPVVVFMSKFARDLVYFNVDNDADDAELVMDRALQLAAVREAAP